MAALDALKNVLKDMEMHMTTKTTNVVPCETERMETVGEASKNPIMETRMMTKSLILEAKNTSTK